MAGWTRRIAFKVDVAGIIHIMGTALYSRPEAAIRELLQNAHDAVVRRRRAELAYEGRIDLVQDPERHLLEVHDDGIGLSAEEAEQYLGTLGIGITGLLKGEHPSAGPHGGDAGRGDGLIGQFGIGLFSAFMLASEVVVDSRRAGDAEPVRWRAGAGTEIELSAGERESTGTRVTLHLKPEHHALAEHPEALETLVRGYADQLPIPIFVNRGARRTNVIHASWFDPTPDREAVALELETHFEETPLDVIPVRVTDPVRIRGALYVSPQRTPGFAGEARVTATVHAMSVSPRIQGLLPAWAPFLRGVLELTDCRPTASREDLVRDAAFDQARRALEEFLYAHFERLASADAPRWEAVLAWHRYTWAGAALGEPRLAVLLRRSYKFPTSQGPLTFDAILERSRVAAGLEPAFDRILWYQSDRRQERWMNSLFAGMPAPCVHAQRSFEESLLALLVGASEAAGRVDLRYAAPSAPGFVESILGVRDLEEAPAPWQEFLASTGARVLCASFRAEQPVMAFLNEQHELRRTFDDLKREGEIPPGFQRLIDRHFAGAGARPRNEVLLNRAHRLVARALGQRTSAPLAGVVRLLAHQALAAVGATLPAAAHREGREDLDWIAEALWGAR